jgi:hypothetical protein
LTKVITILALTCVLVVGAAVTSILSRDSIPSAGMAASLADLKRVVSNREDKQDKLTAAVEPAPAAAPLSTASLDAPLRQAYASSTDADLEAAKAVTVMPAPEPVTATAAAPAAPSQPSKPKVASHLQAQKYAVLSDAQIAGIKQRLRLTSSQEYYWPGVEQALRAIAHKVELARHVNPNANAGSLDPDSAEVQQLKSAAMPLLFQLREDQKDEVRKLARIIGLDKVAAAI